MTRPVGVTASAIVAVVGSIIMLLFAGLAIGSLFVASPNQPPNAQAVVAGALTIAAFGLVGIWTAVGLFGLRPWARTAILVVSGMTVGSSIFAIALIMLFPMPADLSPDTVKVFRWTMGVIFGVPLLIAVWWLIQFNRESTKAAFQSALGAQSRLPIGVAFVAWIVISGGVFTAAGLLSQAPAFLLGMTLTGWSAGIFYSFFTAASVYIGKGLLELNERARVLAIWWFVLPLLHGILLSSVPSFRQRLLEAQQEATSQQSQAMPIDPGVIINIALAISLIMTAVAVWILMKNRPAFARTESY